jgi:methionyl-tRNA formyltransferase
MQLRIAFAGTADFASTHLQHLIAAQKYKIVSVYTKADKAIGRGQTIQYSKVKQLALEHNLTLYQPASLDNSVITQQIADQQLDVLIVVAYGLKIPVSLLHLPKYGCINVHASLLPKYRGAAPIQDAILAGDSATGVSIMQMDEHIDTGPVLLQQSCPILPSDTSDSLYLKLASLGKQALVGALDQLASLRPQAQNDALASGSKKIRKQDGLINWQQDAATIERQIRAYNSWPVAFTQCNDKTVRIWQAQVIELDDMQDIQTPGTIVEINDIGILVRCGINQPSYLQLEKLQLPGKQTQDAAVLLNSHKQFFVNAGKFT